MPGSDSSGDPSRRRGRSLLPARARYLLGRLGFAAFAAYLLLSVTFLFVALTPDPNEAFVQLAAAQSGHDTEPALAAYRAARNQNVPLHQRYVRWIVGYVTFDWGISFSTGRPVLSAVADRLVVSLYYLVPGVALAAWGGLAVGLWTALRPTSLPGRLAAGLGVVLGAVPSYWLGHLLVQFALQHLGMTHLFRWEGGPLSGPNAYKVAFAALTIALALLMVQLRYVRSGTAEFARTTAARLVRAKGGRDVDVARHAVRLLGASFLTLFLTESLTVLFLGMYVVEEVFRIPGFGELSLLAIERRDVPLVLGTTYVMVTVGLLGTLVEDVVEAVLDPRLGD